MQLIVNIVVLAAIYAPSRVAMCLSTAWAGAQSRTAN